MSLAVSRRTLLAGLVGISTLMPRRAAAQAKTPLVVYKDASCGCCRNWVKHMEASGFAATVHDTLDMASVKARNKVPTSVESCHTALVGNYVIEGHVPAADVKRLLTSKPAGIVGLTIPGMPASAPGMDVQPFQPYTVLTFDATGKTTTFARHDKP